MRLTKCLTLFLLGSITAFQAHASPKIKVVTTIPDLASIAAEVGGEEVDVFAIAKGYQDPHFVDAKPSFMIKLQDADLFVQVGLGLEIGWVPPLLEGSRNAAILPGGSGFVDASAGISALEVPVGDLAALRAAGDIHADGNPHYWLDPENGKIIARNICEGLIRINPSKKEYFKNNLLAFESSVDSRIATLKKVMSPYKGRAIIAYHNTWPYLEKTFGFKIVTFVEPKPGIPPTPKYLVQVIQAAKKNNVRVIIIAPYYSRKSSALVAEETGATVVELATSVGAYPEIKNYLDLFSFNVGKLVAAFKQKQ